MHEQYYNIFDSKRRNKIICCFVERINLVALLNAAAGTGIGL